MLPHANLSLDQSPPLSVPLRFFLTAPLFLAAAGAALTVEGPTLLTGRWGPGALALTHLITLGVLAMAMCGALLQFLPVAIGSTIPRPLITAGAIHALLTAGSLLLPWGLHQSDATVILLGSGLLAAALPLFLLATTIALARARAAYATVWAIGLALAALTVALSLGLILAAGHAGLLPLARQLTDGHLAWGVGGWIGLLVVGVAYQVVPLFQITPDYPRWLKRALAPWLFTALALFLCALLVPATAPFRWPALLALAAGFAAFAVATLALQRRRKRKIEDATLWFWRLGMGLLLLAIALGTAHLGGVEGLEMAFGVTAVALVPLTLISGMSYKIAPFLVWLHLNSLAFRRAAVGVKVPHMKEVISEQAARRHFKVHAVATATVIAATILPVPLARPAGALVIATAAFYGWNLWRTHRLYRRTAGEIEEAAGQTIER
ncbi:hypothetical protein [Endothiovibrio diazotrophicus]